MLKIFNRKKAVNKQCADEIKSIQKDIQTTAKQYEAKHNLIKTNPLG
nr:hypothetical protein [uncultured Blautia sp.]